MDCPLYRPSGTSSTHHEGAGRNQISLGQAQGAPPMNGQHANHPKVPQQYRDRNVIHGLVQLDKDLSAVVHRPRYLSSARRSDARENATYRHT